MVEEMRKQAEARRKTATQVRQGIVVDESVFNNEIDQIYSEYKAVDAYDNLSELKLLQKYLRSKGNTFHNARKPVTSEMRALFADARIDIATDRSYSETPRQQPPTNPQTAVRLIRQQLSSTGTKTTRSSSSLTNKVQSKETEQNLQLEEQKNTFLRALNKHRNLELPSQQQQLNSARQASSPRRTFYPALSRKASAPVIQLVKQSYRGVTPDHLRGNALSEEETRSATQTVFRNFTRPASAATTPSKLYAKTSREQESPAPQHHDYFYRDDDLTTFKRALLTQQKY